MDIFQTYDMKQFALIMILGISMGMCFCMMVFVGYYEYRRNLGMKKDLHRRQARGLYGVTH